MQLPRYALNAEAVTPIRGKVDINYVVINLQIIVECVARRGV